jgi:hypothetical protein
MRGRDEPRNRNGDEPDRPLLDQGRSLNVGERPCWIPLDRDRHHLEIAMARVGGGGRGGRGERHPSPISAIANQLYKEFWQK